MKTQTKTIAVVLALFLVAACFVGSAAAVRTVVNGDDAFVYEQIDYAGIALADKLIKFSGDATPVALNTISATSLAGGTPYFDLLEGAVGTYTGTYYLNALGSGTTFNIWYPEMTLKAYLGATSFDTIDGKTINKQTDVRFVIEAPKVGPATGAGLVAPVKIVFTTPVGGKTTDFGNGQFDATSLGGFAGNVQLVTPVAAAQPADAAGTYVAQAEFTNSGFIGIPDKYKKSNTISFTVQSTSLTLTANKDSVVRSNPFTVTIQGQSQFVYFVYLDGATENDVNPTLQDGQSGMKDHLLVFADNANVPTNAASGTPLFQMSSAFSTLQGTSAYFATDASGKRTVQYNTDADTEDKTYTVKVYEILSEAAFVFGPNNYANENDKVKVKVEKGAVTITASGDRSYYIGEEIKLTGTNTDSSNVFLFITGPNLLSDGQMLTRLPTQVTADTVRTNDVTVKTDNTWEYKWDTSGCGLDTGAYTIYATSVLTNGKSSAPNNGVKLSDSEYATVSVNLKQPFLSATPSGTTVAKGDKIYIRGTAEGDPSTLKLYVFGPNYFLTESITVEDDGSYEKKLDIDSGMSSNQYYVVIEHPMYNGRIDVDDTGAATDPRVLSIANTAGGEQASFIVWGTNKLQGSNAADALTKMIDSANIDDIYTKLTFTVAEPWIKINNPGDQAVGTTFTISGTTNLAVDDQILIEVVSSSFNAIDKTSTSTTSGFSQTTKVVKGDGTDNAWSIEVDTTNFKLDEYTIKAQGIETDVTTTTNFNLVEKVNPTVTPTATVTGGQPTTTATTAVPTDVPKTPGFGAFIALAGLGAVALLVLRRN